MRELTRWVSPGYLQLCLSHSYVTIHEAHILIPTLRSLAVLFALYMVLGVLYNRFVLELRGLDQIPRYSLFSFGDSVALFHRCVDWIRSRSAWHSDSGLGWANGGSAYSGLAASHDEQEAIMHGPPGFLDEQDEEEEEHPTNVP